MAFGNSLYTQQGTTTNDQFVTSLYEGYLQRDPDSGGYSAWLNYLNGGGSRDTARSGFANSGEFQQNVSRLCVTTSGTTGIKYVMADAAGSTRVVMSGSSIIARHDFLPFGEELWSPETPRSAQVFSSTGSDAVAERPSAGSERLSNGQSAERYLSRPPPAQENAQTSGSSQDLCRQARNMPVAQSRLAARGETSHGRPERGASKTDFTPRFS